MSKNKTPLHKWERTKPGKCKHTPVVINPIVRTYCTNFDHKQMLTKPAVINP